MELLAECSPLCAEIGLEPLWKNVLEAFFFHVIDDAGSFWFWSS